MLHAKVAKLNQHTIDPRFDRALRHINDANLEGLEEYEVEVDGIEPEARMDLVSALEEMGYEVEYEEAYESLYIRNNQ